MTPTENEAALLYLAFVHQAKSQVDDLREKIEAWQYSIEQHAKHAKEHGATWEQIGNELGITKQAAEQRYGKRTR